MYPTLDFFSYDLGDPILIPADDDSETASKTIDSSIFGKSFSSLSSRRGRGVGRHHLISSSPSRKEKLP